MSKKRKLILALVAIIVLIQFIRPAKNIGQSYGENDITTVVTTSTEVKNILEKSCFDCHSNNTNYPWYNNIQPIAFWLADHVNEGKDELNFSEFKNYKLKRQDHKLEEIIEMVEENEMPLSSYTITHENAKLSDFEKETLIKWAKEGRNELGYTPEN
ncbi:MAG: heme-binding domain-containing protein [Bacteroidia bacterium]|nr:heme-binding domain-containing protein [Bacteroidia bacterium]